MAYSIVHKILPRWTDCSLVPGSFSRKGRVSSHEWEKALVLDLSINPQLYSCWLLMRSLNSTNLQALCHDVIVFDSSYFKYTLGYRNILKQWPANCIEALEREFVRLKSRGSLPEPSYSPELPSPWCTRRVWESNQPDCTHHGQGCLS